MYGIEDEDDDDIIIKSWKISDKRLSYIAYTDTTFLQFLDYHSPIASAGRLSLECGRQRCSCLCVWPW